jgi:excisionase family DNA binding protein
MSNDTMEDRLLTVKEAARLLSVAPTTLYQWAYERRIPSVKLMGSALRFRASEIERIIRAGERPARRRSPGPADGS